MRKIVLIISALSITGAALILTLRLKGDPLARHIAAQSKVQKYQVSSYSSGRGTTTVTQVQLKNDQFLLAAEDFIIADNTLYYMDGDTWKFRVLDPQTSQQYFRFHPNQIKQNLLSSQTTSIFTKVGQEECGGLKCFKYTQNNPKDPGAIRTFWFDTKDYLLRKDVFTYGEFTSENTYTYDQIDIILPI